MNGMAPWHSFGNSITLWLLLSAVVAFLAFFSISWRSFSPLARRTDDVPRGRTSIAAGPTMGRRWAKPTLTFMLPEIIRMKHPLSNAA